MGASAHLGVRGITGYRASVRGRAAGGAGRTRSSCRWRLVQRRRLPGCNRLALRNAKTQAARGPASRRKWGQPADQPESWSITGDATAEAAGSLRTVLDQFLCDLRHGARALKKSPAFSAAAVAQSWPSPHAASRPHQLSFQGRKIVVGRKSATGGSRAGEGARPTVSGLQFANCAPNRRRPAEGRVPLPP